MESAALDVSETALEADPAREQRSLKSALVEIVREEIDDDDMPVYVFAMRDAWSDAPGVGTGS